MKNKFILSEREKNRISKMHHHKILMERQGDVTTDQTTTQQTTTAPTTNQPPTNPLAGRWDTATCAGKPKYCNVTDLKRQMKINDFCSPDILNKTLETLSKGRTGEAGSYKLLEDGYVGNTTKTVFRQCKTSIDEKVAKLKGTVPGAQPTQTGPKIIPVGGNLTANDIATLIS